MIEWLKHSSDAINGFPMGDPHERRFPAYIPPKYDGKRSDPYPVIFFLAGWGGRSSKYLEDGSFFDKPLDLVFDEAIISKKIPPFIGVFPDGSSKLGCSQYVNSPATGNYMDYICDELTEFIDGRYNTHRDPGFRGITGHSSGGFGALLSGMMRSDRFQFICSSAGDSFFEVSLLTTIVPALNEIEKAGGVETFLAKVFETPGPSRAGRKKMEALLTISLAPCYAPDVTKGPVFGDLLFDLKTGNIVPEVFEKYRNFDPVHAIDRHLEPAQKLKFVHLECGLEDEYAAQWGHRQLAEKLKKYKIPHQLDEYPGGHSGHHWRFGDRVALMLEKMFA